VGIWGQLAPTNAGNRRAVEWPAEHRQPFKPTSSDPEDVSVETVAGIASKTPLARILAAEKAFSFRQSPYLSS
jgi:hypothetical protein